MFNESLLAENAWLGARLDISTKKYYWDHDIEPYFPYENWEQLKNDLRHGCVEMISHGEDKGKWTYAPNYIWQEVTQQYSNLFFRAQGNKTEAFGKVQQ